VTTLLIFCFEEHWPLPFEVLSSTYLGNVYHQVVNFHAIYHVYS